MTPDELQREKDLLKVLETLADWKDGYTQCDGDLGDVDWVARGLYDTIEKLYDDGYDRVSGGDFMDGLKRENPKLYWFTVGFFGSHDFVWKIKE